MGELEKRIKSCHVSNGEELDVVLSKTLMPKIIIQEWINEAKQEFPKTVVVGDIDAYYKPEIDRWFKKWF